MKKFELTSESIDWLGKKLFRIRALTTFSDVQAGDDGGYVEKEENLSHDGNAWINDNAKVFGNVTISDNAQVRGNALVHGNAQVRGNAWVDDNAEVCNNAQVRGNALVRGNARVRDNAQIDGNAEVCDNAQVRGNALVCHNAQVRGNACIDNNAAIHSNADYATIKDFGCDYKDLTFFQCSDKKVRMKCEHFYGTIEEFISYVQSNYGDTKLSKEYLMISDLMKYHFSSDTSSDSVVTGMSLF